MTDSARSHHDSDHALVVAAIAKNPRAASMLYERHWPAAYRVAHRMTGEPTLAADCAHDALVRAFNGLDKFREGSRFSTWLHVITRRVVLNALRDKRRERHTTLTDDLPSITPYEPRWLNYQPAVARAINALPERERRLVVMRYYEGHGTDDIAAIVGIRPAMVRQYLYRARRRLRSALQVAVDERVA